MPTTVARAAGAEAASEVTWVAVADAEPDADMEAVEVDSFLLMHTDLG